MEQMVNTTTGELSLLDSLAEEARFYRDRAERSLYQLARVLTEAKRLVPHGQWGAWVEQNADMSQRTAQNLMAAYERFGGNARFDGIGRAKLFKLLALPAGSEDAFMDSHDVEDMSAREVERAVQEARAAMEEELQAEKRARAEAEKRAAEAEGRQEVPEELLTRLREQERQIKLHQEEIARVSGVAQDALEQKRQLQQENREQQELLQEQQEDYNRVQAELLNAQSALAKGDAERDVKDRFTADVFAQAVRQFLGVCFRVPHMQAAFAGMSTGEKAEYNELLCSVEAWARDSRRALEAESVEGAWIHG